MPGVSLLILFALFFGVGDVVPVIPPLRFSVGRVCEPFFCLMLLGGQSTLTEVGRVRSQALCLGETSVRFFIVHCVRRRVCPAAHQCPSLFEHTWCSCRLKPPM